MKKLLATVAFFSSAGASLAQNTIYTPQDFSVAWVQVVDEAKNGCWTNIGEVQTYAEDQMRLAGFNVVDEPVVPDGEPSPALYQNGVILWVNVVGQRLGDGLCVGYVNSTFFATMINPNREEISFINPIGNTIPPYSVWSNGNFNTYALDYVKVAINAWTKHGIGDE